MYSYSSHEDDIARDIATGRRIERKLTDCFDAFGGEGVCGRGRRKKKEATRQLTS